MSESVTAGATQPTVSPPRPLLVLFFYQARQSLEFQANRHGNLDESISAGANVSVTGVSGTSDIGTVTTTAGASFTPTRVSGTSAVGTVTFAISSSVAVSGVESTSGLGSVTPFAGADVSVTGFDLVSGLGSVTFVVSVDVTLGSVGATGRIGKLISWNNIVPDPVTNWSTVTPSPNQLVRVRKKGKLMASIY